MTTTTQTAKPAPAQAAARPMTIAERMAIIVMEQAVAKRLQARPTAK